MILMYVRQAVARQGPRSSTCDDLQCQKSLRRLQQAWSRTLRRQRKFGALLGPARGVCGCRPWNHQVRRDGHDHETREVSGNSPWTYTRAKYDVGLQSDVTTARRVE